MEGSKDLNRQERLFVLQAKLQSLEMYNIHLEQQAEFLNNLISDCNRKHEEAFKEMESIKAELKGML